MRRKGLGSLLLLGAILGVGACQRERGSTDRADALTGLHRHLTQPIHSNDQNEAFDLVLEMPACPTALWHPQAGPGRARIGRNIVRHLKVLDEESDPARELRAAMELGFLIGTLTNATNCARAEGMEDHARQGARDILLEMLTSNLHEGLQLPDPFSAVVWKGRSRAEIAQDLDRVMSGLRKDEEEAWRMVFYWMGRSLQGDIESMCLRAHSIVLHQMDGEPRCTCSDMEW